MDKCYKAYPRVVRKQSSEQTAMAAVVSAEQPKLVRRRTWTKEEAEEALQAQARRQETTVTQKITSDEYQAGERFAVLRQEDHLKMEVLGNYYMILVF